ncbi:hypothetical protein [Flammeovirga sp. EKP202]|uniref:hypothetical protein n=1 Tax=Flammeovirga sp. EKP202 TaxID=2770592 RepID=UPI00165FD764|nr:hypothetical protein [Flammeovirga sp. EKP202]
MRMLLNILLLSILLSLFASCGSTDIEPKRQYTTIEGDGTSNGSTKYYIFKTSKGNKIIIEQFIVKHNGEIYGYTWTNNSEDNLFFFSASSFEGSWANGANGHIDFVINSSDQFSLSTNTHNQNDCYNYRRNLKHGNTKDSFYVNNYTEKSAFTEINYGPFCISNMSDFYLHR